MTVYSRFATLVNGVERGIDLSASTSVLNVYALQIGGVDLSGTGTNAHYTGTPTGASTAVTITANNTGTAGNVTLTFSGSNTISGEIATWNGANPTNMVTLTSGNGTQTPTSGTISLTGGTGSISGSMLIGNSATYTNFTPTSATIAGALMGINTALAGVSGSAITSLTGDVTATGPGAAAATLATVNSDVGSYTLANVTVNAKGLVTAASTTASTGSGNVVLATSPTLVAPALGTPSALVGTNITGTAAGLTAGTVTTNANLTGDVTSSGNATTLAATSNSTLTTLSALTTAGSLAISGSQVSGGAFGAINGSALTNLAAANVSGVLPVGVTGGSGLSINYTQLIGTIPTWNQNTTGTAANITATTNATLTTLSSLSLPGSQVSGNISGNAANVTGVVALINGGTGTAAASANAAFDALSPMTTAGDLIYENATPTAARLAIGSTGDVLTVAGGVPTWAAPAASGTVTSVALADGSTTPIYNISGSPVTSTGTLDFTLKTQAAHSVFAGPTTGSVAQPTFRSLVSADIPDLSATYVTQSEVGAASGVASLDGGGKVPLSQLPATLMEFQGSWNPNTNTPALVDGTGVTGYTYWVSALDTGIVSGLTDPSMHNFQIGDLVIYNGTKWVLVTPAAGVQSVNGAQGAVTVNAINQLTGDITAGPASGSQSVAATLATVNSNVGSFGSSTSIPSFTVNAKGLITAASGNVVVAPAGTLSGTTLNSTVVSSSLTSVGTITSGTWTGTTIAIANGGTGATTKSTAFDALSPMTTGGDLIYGGASGTGTRLANGSAGQVLTSAGTTLAPTWAAPAAPTSAPLVTTTVVAGQTFAANTTYAVRWDMSSKSETSGQVYAADQDTTAPSDMFWVIGVISGGAGGVTAGQSIPMTSLGMWTLGSSDGTFAATGVPVWLTSAGAFSLTAPTTAGFACTKIGMVQSSSQMWISPQVMGVN